MSPMVYSFAIGQWVFENATGGSKATDAAFSAMFDALFSDMWALSWLALVFVSEIFVSARENELILLDD